MSSRPISTDVEKRRRALFDRAMQLPDTERTTFIERETTGDPLLREAVLRLLAASRADDRGVLDRPLCDRGPISSPGLPSSIGGYPVVRRLGAGGMGEVFLCREPRGGGLVAVKLLNAELRSRNFLRRFENERLIQSRLIHPNVCRILGSGETGHGAPFIVMEHAEGEHIDVFCRRMRSTPAQCLLLFSQILAAVEYFHKQDIVHRDLKPSNILVNTAGAVKILDFGVAKVVEHASGLTGRPSRVMVNDSGRPGSAMVATCLPEATSANPIAGSNCRL
jgi:serine/threonine protein kinase